MFHFAGALCIICFVWQWQCLTNADGDDDDDDNDDDYADVMTVMTAVMIKEIQLYVKYPKFKDILNANEKDKHVEDKLGKRRRRLVKAAEVVTYLLSPTLIEVNVIMRKKYFICFLVDCVRCGGGGEGAGTISDNYICACIVDAMTNFVILSRNGITKIYLHRAGTFPSKNITFKCYAVIVKLTRYGMTNTSSSSSSEVLLIKFYDTLHALLPTYENAVN
uniref:Uncharacterized protein n=1 Tax=Glossina austeni TaxID=7395 RepID=A0A1A9VU01_GLOAU